MYILVWCKFILYMDSFLVFFKKCIFVFVGVIFLIRKKKYYKVVLFLFGGVVIFFIEFFDYLLSKFL